MIKGLVHSLAGALNKTAYAAGTKSNPFQVGRASLVRFYVEFAPDVSSDITTLTIKLTHRYRDPGLAAITGTVMDLPSDKGDTSKTFEVEHAFTITAGAPASFFLAAPNGAKAIGIPEIIIDMKVNATGKGTDLISVYAVTE